MDKQIEDFHLVLTDLTNALVGQFVMSDLLDKIVSTTMRILDAEVCSIFLEDKENEPGILKMVAGSGPAAPLVGIAQYSIGQGLTGFVFKTGETIKVNSQDELAKLDAKTANKPVWKGTYDSYQWDGSKTKFRNLIVIPLKIKDQKIGVIKVENKLETISSNFSLYDENVLLIIANVISLAIENARLHKNIESQMKAISSKAAHRLNNQCTNYDAIQLDLELVLTENKVNNENLKSIYNRLVDTTKNIKMLISEFRFYGKPLSINREPCDINRIIKDEIWLAKVPKNIIIQTDLFSSNHKISVDGQRLAESIKELIHNAIKAINRSKKENGKIVITTKYSNFNFTFRIEDDGPGFPPSFPVFEPFNTTDPNSTGLGLATVKELIERHGGTIQAFTGEFSGACIEFTIPIE